MKPKLITDSSGDKYWRLPNGDLHREDGPAIEWSHGEVKRWYINDKLHREDGPAIEGSNNNKYWYINGINYTEQEYKIETRSRKLNYLLK
jgi:hypothetical protein